MLKIVVPALAALSLAAPLQAKEPDAETARVVVPYADLDLASQAGAAALQSRIASAVKQVCGRTEGPELQAWAEWQKCRQQAMQGVNQQLAALRVDSPVVALAR